MFDRKNVNNSCAHKAAAADDMGRSYHVAGRFAVDDLGVKMFREIGEEEEQLAGQSRGKQSLSIVIPVFNGEASLPLLLERLLPVLEAAASDFEVILVNDGSHDRSWEIICTLASEHQWVRGLDLMRNYGQHNALLCGVRAARYNVVLTMDDDLQNPPEEIPKLIAEIEAGADVVYGTPAIEQHGIFRNLASQISKLALQNAIGAETARQVSAFRAFRTSLRQAFSAYQGPFVSIDVLLTWATRRFIAVRVDHHPRRLGSSNYTLGKLLVHAMNMMTGFSTLPLRLASLVGFLFTLFGLGVLAFVLARYLVNGGVVPGFAFLASTIAILSGAQLFALGIIGEYLARMHFRIMDRPAYTVRRTSEESLILA